MPLKVFDFWCEPCDTRCDDVLVSGDEKPPCPDCHDPMTKLFSAPKSLPQGRFQPFWSDTMQMRINDREDLQKLRKYAKDNGLVNVGHRATKPDKAAIRHNYEND